MLFMINIATLRFSKYQEHERGWLSFCCWYCEWHFPVFPLAFWFKDSSASAFGMLDIGRRLHPGSLGLVVFSCTVPTFLFLINFFCPYLKWEQFLLCHYMLYNQFFKNILKFIFILWLFCLFVCLLTTCMPGDWGDEKKSLYPLELDLQMVVTCQMGAGTWTQVLWEAASALNTEPSLQPLDFDSFHEHSSQKLESDKHGLTE